MEERIESYGRLDVLARAMTMISVQAGCPVDDALTLMTERAKVTRRTIEETALATIDGTIRFDE